MSKETSTYRPGIRPNTSSSVSSSLGSESIASSAYRSRSPFANLHTLIQYMFGWSDTHLHHAEVYPNVVLHDEQELLGTIKSCGRKRPLEDYELGDPIADRRLDALCTGKSAYLSRTTQGHSQKGPVNSVMTMEEKGVTLESIWSHNEAHNVSDGQCSNAQIAIVYTYDSGWYIDHIHHLAKPLTGSHFQMNGRCTSLVDKGISSTICILPAISPFSNMPKEL
ncbi:hypothetical protein J3R83DRAFT_13088 [Lanmaoa asiatica]|nr:hypothetical protein J3R83DRAFT_13088 [Lanmaoa asiatica]